MTPPEEHRAMAEELLERFSRVDLEYSPAKATALATAALAHATLASVPLPVVKADVGRCPSRNFSNMAYCNLDFQHEGLHRGTHLGDVTRWADRHLPYEE